MASMKVHRAIRCYDEDRTVCNTANAAWVTDDPEQVTCGRCSLMEMAKHGPTATPTGEERDR